MFNSALKQQVERLELRLVSESKRADLISKHAAEDCAELRHEIKKLKKRLKQVDATLLPYKNPQPQSFFGNAPIAVSETEEDAQWQLDAGLIDKREYQQLVAELGLDPTIEVQL